MQNFDDLQAFMRVATVKGAAPKSKFNIFNYASTDTLRPAFTGVYHHELTNSEGEPYAGVAVATDAHILVVSSKDYKEEIKGEIMRKDGTLMKYDAGETLKFPNYQMVIESAEKRNIHTAPIPEISEYYTQELAKFEVDYKLENKRTKLTPFIGLAFSEETLWFSYHNLVRFITAARHIGATELSYAPSASSPILATGENPLDKVILMPLAEYNDEGKHVTEYATFAKYNDPDEDL